jgi:hypothetical protein
VLWVSRDSWTIHPALKFSAKIERQRLSLTLPGIYTYSFS